MAEVTLESPVTVLKGIGPKKAKLLERLDVHTVGDLLHLYPRSYIDYTSPIKIRDIVAQEVCAVRAKVLNKLTPRLIRSGLVLYKAIIADGTGEITVTIFNSSYQFDRLRVGKTYTFHGKVTGSLTGLEMASPSFIPDGDPCKLIPVYPLTEGLYQSVLQELIRGLLDTFCGRIPETLPPGLLQAQGLCGLEYALDNIHYPADAQALEAARKRLAFEELLMLQLGLLQLKKSNRSRTACPMKDVPLDAFYASLPFALTDAQRRVIGECTGSMQGDYPMNRLVQGEVGSGKTVVAAAICCFAVRNGYQCALMAPTEILAAQHFKTLTQFLSPVGIRVCLLTGALTPAKKRQLREQIASGAYDVVVGTHALVQKDTQFQRLGLVITDEQHRFGVAQRTTLAEKGENPHLMVMSATPIPRSLALILYGDLDISVIDQLPQGRQPIETYKIGPDKLQRAYGFIRRHLDEGRQGYIVCPVIDESESELVSVGTYREELAKGPFEGYTTGLLHGRLSGAEKEAVMGDFAAGRIQLLVATTVIEVGVDVPNAVIMLVRNAERFGLSQLHQLRGRIGRGQYQSTCILETASKSPETLRRLRTMCRTTSGYDIAMEDLCQRGPGDFFGSRQHGLPPLRIAGMDALGDLSELGILQSCAARILDDDPQLESPYNAQLKKNVDRMFRSSGTI